MEISFDRKKIYIDVRSESEFAKGHITGAIHLPILYDDERKEVGYIYKHCSAEDAKRTGVEFASKKLTDFYKSVEKLAACYGEDRLVFYCARGGYRSQSVYLFLKGLGLKTKKLDHGYKGYRSVVLSYLESSAEHFPKFIGINGLTGTGKTGILNTLESLGEPVLNLERAARHKGSNLGGIGMILPQSAQQFENDLFAELKQAEERGYCFVEMESRKIGGLLVPKTLYTAYHDRTTATVWIQKSMESRIDTLLEDYTTSENFKKEFMEGMQKIKPYIPSETYRRVIGHLECGEYRALTEILLREYYDPMYKRSTALSRKDLIIENRDEREAAKQIIAFKNELMDEAKSTSESGSSSP